MLSSAFLCHNFYKALVKQLHICKTITLFKLPTSCSKPQQISKEGSEMSGRAPWACEQLTLCVAHICVDL